MNEAQAYKMSVVRSNNGGISEAVGFEEYIVKDGDGFEERMVKKGSRNIKEQLRQRKNNK